MKKADPNPKANRHILMITYGMAALFAGLVLYFAFFLQIKSESVINNSYNARLDSFSDRVVRGSILSSDGRVWPVQMWTRTAAKRGTILTIPCFPT